MEETLSSKTYRLNLEKNKTSFLTWILEYNKEF